MSRGTLFVCKNLVENERKSYMIKISETDERYTPAKKNIKLEGIYVDQLRFVDETRDITKEVIDALPPGTDRVSFKITVELSSDMDSE